MGKIILVTGGARSGKSTFAEQYITRLGGTVAYIATAQEMDEEMTERIRHHRRRRPEGWLTVEAPFAAEEAMAQLGAKVEAVLFDCITLYISNLLLAADDQESAEQHSEYILGKIGQLVACADQGGATVVFVTNEVGLGIVPDNPLAREYRDIAGRVNQQIAAMASEVYWVVSGLAVDVKKLATVLPSEGQHG